MSKNYDMNKFQRMLNAFMNARWEKLGLLHAVRDLSAKSLDSNYSYVDKNGTRIQFNPRNTLIGRRSPIKSLYELACYWISNHPEENVNKWSRKIRPWHFKTCPNGTWTKTWNNVVIRTNYKLAQELTRKYVRELAKKRYGYEWMVFLRATKKDFHMELTDAILDSEISFNGSIMLQRVYGDRTPAALIDLYYNSDYKERFPFLTVEMMREKRAPSRIRKFIGKIPKRQLEKILTTSYVTESSDL